MKNEKYAYQEIRDYLTGKLSSENAMRFEERLNSDASLREQVETEKQLIGALKVLGNASVRETLDRLDREDERRRRGGRIMLFVAMAAVVLIIFIVWKSLVTHGNQEPQNQFQHLAEQEVVEPFTDTPILTERDVPGDNDSMRIDALLSEIMDLQDSLENMNKLVEALYNTEFLDVSDAEVSIGLSDLTWKQRYDDLLISSQTYKAQRSTDSSLIRNLETRVVQLETALARDDLGDALNTSDNDEASRLCAVSSCNDLIDGNSNGILRSTSILFVNRTNYEYEIAFVFEESNYFTKISSRNGGALRAGDEMIFVNSLSERRTFSFIDRQEQLEEDDSVTESNLLLMDRQSMEWIMNSDIPTVYVVNNITNSLRKLALDPDVQEVIRGTACCFLTILASQGQN